MAHCQAAHRCLQGAASRECLFLTTSSGACRLERSATRRFTECFYFRSNNCHESAPSEHVHPVCQFRPVVSATCGGDPARYKVKVDDADATRQAGIAVGIRAGAQSGRQSCPSGFIPCLCARSGLHTAGHESAAAQNWAAQYSLSERFERS